MRWAYGGDECTPDSPTHYCVDCGTALYFLDSQQLFFPFPETCHFCEQMLTKNEKFSFSMEFEDWIDADDSSLRLTDDTFSMNVFPLCESCRDGIRENKREMEIAAAHEDQQRVITSRIATAGFAFVVALLTIAYLISR